MKFSAEAKRSYVRYSEILFKIIFVLLLTVIISVYSFNFIGSVKYEEGNIKMQLDKDVLSIDNLLKVSVNNIQILKSYTEREMSGRVDYNSNEWKTVKEWNKQNENGRTMALDTIENDILEYKTSNLIGLTDKEAKGISSYTRTDRELLQKEAYYILKSESLFYMIHKVMSPSATWVYYVSQNGFSLICPWTDRKANEDMLQRCVNADFYKLSKLKEKKEAGYFWTSPYVDYAGKGLLVTLASPVYMKDIYKGVLGIDISLSEIDSYIMGSSYNGTTVCIVDRNNKVLASNIAGYPDKTGVKSLDEILPENIKKSTYTINASQEESISGGYLIYKKKLKNADWTMEIILPYKKLLMDSFNKTRSNFIVTIIGLLAMSVYASRTIRILFTNQKKLIDELYEKATVDELTQCYNRRFFLSRLERQVESAIKYNMELSIIMLDIDFFKNINDTYGHQTGDKVIKNVVEVIKEVIRRDAILGRLGGEEFAIILPDTNLKNTYKIAERIRKNIMKSSIDLEDGKVVKTTLSIGITSIEDGDYDINRILGRSDKAMYEAKNNGRNCIYACKEGKFYTMD